MKYLIVFLSLLLIVFSLIFPHQSKAVAPDNFQWVTHQSGASGGAFIAGIEVDPSDANTIYILTSASGVYKTTNGGTSWTASNTGLPTNKSILWTNFGSQLTMDPNNSSILYAVINGQVYKSTDSAASWSFASSGTTVSAYDGSSTSELLAGVIVDKNNSNHLFAATVASGFWGGVFASTSGGSTWSQIAGTTTGGNWININFWTNDAWPLAIDPSNSNNLYFIPVHNEYGRTLNGGSAWTNMSLGSFDGDATAKVIVHPTNGTVYAAAGLDGLIKSTDNGTTWSSVSSDLSGLAIIDFAFAPSDATIMYAITQTKIYKSTDTGSTWTLESTSATNTWRHMSISPSDTATIFLGAESTGMRKSADSGATVSSISTGLTTTPSFGTFAQSKSNPSIFYGDIFDDGFYKSIDGGYTWTRASAHPGSARSFSNLSIDPTNPNVILAGAFVNPTGYLYRSADGGVTWSVVDTASSTYGITIFRPMNTNNVYTYILSNSTATNRIRKSSDNGITWSVLSTAMDTKTSLRAFELALDPGDTSTLYYAPLNDVPYKSIDDGANWTAIGTGITDVGAYSITVSPYNSSLLFYGSWNSDLYFRSTDGGASWSQVLNTHDYGDANATATTFDAVSSSIVYAGGGNLHAYESTDSGATWALFPSTGLAGTTIRNTVRNWGATGSLIGQDLSNNSKLVIWENYIPKFEQSTFVVNNLENTPEYHAGDLIQFTFHLKNTGPKDGTNTNVKFILPNTITYVANSTTIDGQTVSPDPISQLTMNVLDTTALAYGDDVPIRFNARINNGVSGTIEVDPLVTSTEDTSGTTISNVLINIGFPRVQDNSSGNCPPGWSKCIHTGPHFTQASQYYSMNCPAGSVLIPNTSTKNDLFIDFTQFTNADLLKNKIPLPKIPGFIQVTNACQLKLYASFNGASVSSLDKNGTMLFKYPPKFVNNLNPSLLRIAKYNEAKKRWVILPTKNIINKLNFTDAISFKETGYYMLLYN